MKYILYLFKNFGFARKLILKRGVLQIFAKRRLLILSAREAKCNEKTKELLMN